VQRRTGASERGHAIEEENNPRKLARAKGRAIEKEYRNFDKWKKPRAAEIDLISELTTPRERGGPNFRKPVAH